MRECRLACLGRDIVPIVARRGCQVIVDCDAAAAEHVDEVACGARPREDVQATRIFVGDRRTRGRWRGRYARELTGVPRIGFPDNVGLMIGTVLVNDMEIVAKRRDERVTDGIASHLRPRP